MHLEFDNICVAYGKGRLYFSREQIKVFDAILCENHELNPGRLQVSTAGLPIRAL
jgi:hypothetical protein